MKQSKWFVGGIVAAIAVFLYQYVVHTYVLGGYYDTIRDIMRAQGDISMGVWLVSAFIIDLVLCLGLGCIFLQGYEGKGMGETVRFGFWAGLVFGVYFWGFHWLVFPGPFVASLIQLPVEVIEFILATWVFALVYKPAAKTT